MGYLDETEANPYVAPKPWRDPALELWRAFDFAGFWRRFVSFAIDSILIGTVTLVCIYLLLAALHVTIDQLKTIRAFSSLGRLAVTVFYYGGVLRFSPPPTPPP